jgi:hypothetical protein
MVKKYIIGVDTNIHIGKYSEIRTFMFTKKTMYDTIEEAETKIREKLKEDSDNRDDTPVYYTIIPIYTKA